MDLFERVEVNPNRIELRADGDPIYVLNRSDSGWSLFDVASDATSVGGKTIDDVYAKIDDLMMRDARLFSLHAREVAQ